jgi:Transposase DDE domain
VDVKHEVVLAYEVTDTKAGDGETLPTVLEQAEANLPGDRIETLAYDKAADSQAVHELLAAKKIKPLIQMRSLWETEKERLLPGHDGTSNIVYDEEGTVYCYDKVSPEPVRHKMAYIGYEPDRETLKYRCPAKHEGWDCPMSKVCNAGKSYGKTARVSREIDPRRFPALPRATKKFERMYKGRTAVERVNARLKVFWGVDDGNLTGSRRFVAQVGVVLAVHAAFATLLAAAPRREGTLGKIGLSPIAEAIRAKAKAEAVVV